MYIQMPKPSMQKQNFNQKNSFFALFPKLKLRMLSEIIKIFCSEENAYKCYDKIKNDYNHSISILSVQNVYNEIRNVFTKYYNIVYQSELLGKKIKILYFPFKKVYL